MNGWPGVVVGAIGGGNIDGNAQATIELGQIQSHHSGSSKLNAVFCLVQHSARP